MFFMFDFILRSIAPEGVRFHFWLVFQRFVGVFLYNRLVFSEVVFIPLVDSTGLTILHNFVQNIDGLLLLAPKQSCSGILPLRWFPIDDILACLCWRLVVGFRVGTLCLTYFTCPSKTVISRLETTAVTVFPLLESSYNPAAGVFLCSSLGLCCFTLACGPISNFSSAGRTFSGLLLRFIPRQIRLPLQHDQPETRSSSVALSLAHSWTVQRWFPLEDLSNYATLI